MMRNEDTEYGEAEPTTCDPQQPLGSHQQVPWPITDSHPRHTGNAWKLYRHILFLCDEKTCPSSYPRWPHTLSPVWWENMPFMLSIMAPHSISWVMRGCAIRVKQYGHTVYHPDFTSNSQAVLTMVLPTFISRLNTWNPVHSTFTHSCLTVNMLSNSWSQNILKSSNAHSLGI